MTPMDDLVDDYLERLDRAARVLPDERRVELVAEIREHVAQARAATGQDEAAARTALDRLGSPEEIVAAAREDLPPAGPAAPPSYAPAPRGTGLEVAAVLLLTVGSLVPVVGWLVGVVLLWLSSLWRTREKVLGTLVVPFGPGGLLTFGALLPLGRTETCTSVPAPVPPDAGSLAPADPGPLAPEGFTCSVSGPPEWAYPAVLGAAVLASVAVAVLLLRRAQQRAAAVPIGVPTSASGPAAASPWGALEVAGVVVLALGGLLVPVVGTVVGLVLVCCSPRWTVRDKVVAGLLSLAPLGLAVSALLGRSLL